MILINGYILNDWIIYFQILTLCLFGIVVYLITLPDPGLRQTTSIFVIGTSIAFLFFDSVQIIAHFAGSDLPEYPVIILHDIFNIISYASNLITT